MPEKTKPTFNRSNRLLAGIFAVCLAPLSTGCDIAYLSHLAFGQLGVLARLVPVSQALSDVNLTEEERARLAVTQAVRRFGIDVIGLRGTDSYTVFDYNGREPAAWVVIAGAVDSLTSYLWDYPFIGRASTRGYFDEAYARSEEAMLRNQGYDVFVGRVPGFSTLNFFADPVRQSNLRMEEMELAEFILHEMTHQTVYKLGDGNFNESMATFVGRTAAQMWIEATYGPNSAQAAAARVRFADKLVTDAYVTALYARMAAYYAEARDAGLSREEILVGREAEFDALRDHYVAEFEPRLQDPEHWAPYRSAVIDNARILAASPYQGDLSDYQAVFTRLGGDFRATLAVFAEAANRENSRAYLREFTSQP